MSSLEPAPLLARPSVAAGTERARQALRVIVSPNFGELLARHKVSLLVSTYDAEKLLILRSSGEMLNVHFVNFDEAMGVAVNGQRLAVGTKFRIEELYNMPALCARLPQTSPPSPRYDACYVPRSSHVTGDIDVHEMAFAGDELWFVNTRFSCLCTIDPRYSFRPRWRPPFIKGLSDDDRCHLNGLAVVDGVPRYVSALGVTDEPQGWRAGRASGGMLMDVPSSEIIVGGLSMPHSPRAHAGALWFLESGRGSISRIAPESGRVETIVELPGFTRGLDFSGDLAFVGLSRVRMTSTFGGLPLTDRLPEEQRYCGIQAVNVKTGQVEAFLKFESGVHEIFAVQAIPGIQFPSILEHNDPLLTGAFGLSPEALAQVRRG
jgi:uncharacterized protein (TIGR03032 family)